MKQNKEAQSRQKRDTLVTLKKAGLASVVLGSMGTQWMKPVVTQIVLPAHAQTTQCPGARITAELQQCSQGGTIIITISSLGDAQSPAFKLNDVPKVTVSPTVTYTWPGGSEVDQGTWGITDLDLLPTEIAAGSPYNLTIAGPVTDFDTCMPATDIPVEGGQPLTSIVVEVALICTADGSTLNLSVDVLNDLTPCPCI